MMRALAALALVALLVVPSATAVRSVPAYPDVLARLAPNILAKVAPLENASNASWYPDAKTFLDRAKDEAAAGRFRAALYDAETFQEVVLAHRLQQETNDTTTTLGDARVHVLEVVTGWRADDNATWSAFREHVHAAEGSLRSLHAIETVLYAADLAAQAKAQDHGFEAYTQQFSRQSSVSLDYLLLFVRMTQTPKLDILVAEDVLQAGFAQDGVPPQAVASAWSNITEAALAPFNGSVPLVDERYEELAVPARANHEGMVSLALALAEQGAERYNGMQTQFGDARTRGKDVTGDADRYFVKQLNNTTTTIATTHGLQGLFVADAIDRGVFTQTVAETGAADLGVVLSAWAALDHGNLATSVLAAASPISPPPDKKTPDAGIALVVALVGALALARRFRRA